MVIKEYELNRLRKFLVLGLPIHEICQVMEISRPTYFRYLRRIQKQDKDNLLKDSQNKMISALQTFQDRIGHTVLAMSEIERDKDKTDFVRMQAARIKLEASWAGALLQAEGPSIITKMNNSVRDIALGRRKAPITAEQLEQIKTDIINPNSVEATTTTTTEYVLGDHNIQRTAPKPPLVPKPPLGDWGKEEGEEEEEYEEGFDPTEDPDPDPSFEAAWQQQQELKKKQQAGNSSSNSSSTNNTRTYNPSDY